MSIKTKLIIEIDDKTLTTHVNHMGLCILTESPNTRLVISRDGKYTYVRAVEIKEEERFASRGIGSDNVSCIVCGTKCHTNIAAFVSSKEAGEKIVKMFKQGARLDFRPSEPEWIQVKIGACEAHTTNLKLLDALVVDGFIDENRIKYATNFAE